MSSQVAGRVSCQPGRTDSCQPIGLSQSDWWQTLKSYLPNGAHLTVSLCREEWTYSIVGIHFYEVYWLVTGQHFVLCPTERRAFPLPHPLSCFFFSLTSPVDFGFTLVLWGWKFPHTPHLQAVTVQWNVILKDNMLSDRDAVFEFWPCSGKLWSWNHECAGRSTWGPWDWGQWHPWVQIRYRLTHKKLNKKKSF